MNNLRNWTLPERAGMAYLLSLDIHTPGSSSAFDVIANFTHEVDTLAAGEQTM